MGTHPRAALNAAVTLLMLIGWPVDGQTSGGSQRERRYRNLLQGGRLVRGPVTNLAYTRESERLYYSVSESDSIGTYSLDLTTGEREPLFDTRRMLTAIRGTVPDAPPGPGTAFRRFGLAETSDSRITFSLNGARWTMDLESYEVHPLGDGPGEGGDQRPRVIRSGESGRPDLREVRSPDGTMIATLMHKDAAVRYVPTGETRRITTGGTEDHYWGYPGIARAAWAWWSPGSDLLAVRRVDMKGVGGFPLIRWLETPPEVDWIRNVHNVRVGQPLPREELDVWHAESGRLVSMDMGDPTDAFLYVLGWRPRARELIVLRVTRDYRDVRVLALDPDSGSSRTVLSERFATCWPEQVWAPPLRRYWPLSDGERFLWKSDDGGWDQLFIRGYRDGVVTQLTSGSYPVDDVIGIDEDGGWVYFSARSDEARPYDVHVHRVRLDGSGFSRLTDGRGRHAAQLVAESGYLEVWRRTVDRPTELQIRRSDGELVRTLGTADLSRLRDAGWTPPEEFTVKAADGETDLWGVMFKPADFDPSQRYPVVEFIYGGPVVEYAPRQLPYTMFPHALAQLGYVVVKLDARGTPGRGRNFLEAGWDRASVIIADHAAGIRQLTQRHPYLDGSRVAIVGQSWGGDLTTRALLLAPDVYDVGVAVSGGWWGDPELGRAKATVFEQCAVLNDDEPIAPPLDPLKGDLLVVHGTADLNLSGSTDLMWWLDSVIDAGKYVDLLVLPDRPHHLLQTDRYVQGAIRRYLFQHLGPGG